MDYKQMLQMFYEWLQVTDLSKGHLDEHRIDWIW